MSPRKIKLRKKAATIQRQDVPLAMLKEIVEKTKTSNVLNDQELNVLESMVDTLVAVSQELEAKKASIWRLRRLLFGPSTEKTSQILGESTEDDADIETDDATLATSPAPGDAQTKPSEDDNQPASQGQEPQPQPKAKPKGHGRNGAASYKGAQRNSVPHESLHHGDSCPGCQKGKVYAQLDPVRLIRVTGQAPLSATVWELERLRCNLCGEVYTAPAPGNVGPEKYDEGAAAMIGELKYGTGMPFNRLERLQKDLGIPLPASTQWEIVNETAELLEPAYEEHIRQAAQGQVLYNDDTTAKILSLDMERAARKLEADGTKDDERTGTFTTGIVSTLDKHQIALFFTGQKHAGENLKDVLARRAADLPPPIQMCDGLSRNVPTGVPTLLAGCNSHGRRKFVDEVHAFPEECRKVLETLREVYRTDELVRQEQLSHQDRLLRHQAESGPRMADLEQWMKQQLEEKKVEPNSGLGKAISYMQKHWSKLTLFLRVPGAPLDNNCCERILKMAILNRKNAYFYKTDVGAWVGDLFMTLIHTAELNDANPWEYLVALQKNIAAVTAEPANWMPWNYKLALASPEQATLNPNPSTSSSPPVSNM